MIDLHLHSTFSDGTCTPAELVAMADRRGLRAISITDHDTVDGTGEALEAGVRHGVLVIPGVELSVFAGEVHFHLLGYHFDWRDGRLREGLRLVQESRSRRNTVIIANLRELGLDVSEEEVQAISAGGQTGRPHIARLLVAKKIVRDIDQAFDLYLRKGRKGYVRRFIYQVEEAISLIHASGGCAVLAHPAQISRQAAVLDDLLGRLKAVGLDGVETHYPTQKGQFLRMLGRLAVTHGLFETGGSDYHGDIRPNTTMAGGPGNKVPVELLAQLDSCGKFKQEAIEQ